MFVPRRAVNVTRKFKTIIIMSYGYTMEQEDLISAISECSSPQEYMPVFLDIFFRFQVD